MADINSNTLVGGGDLPKLAPDLSFPGDIQTGSAVPKKTITLNAVGALTTAIFLTGKYNISLLHFTSLTPEATTIKMTVDGVVVYNSTFTSGTQIALLGGFNLYESPIQCDSSFLLDIEVASDSSIFFKYLARPIL